MASQKGLATESKADLEIPEVREDLVAAGHKALVAASKANPETKEVSEGLVAAAL